MAKRTSAKRKRKPVGIFEQGLIERLNPPNVTLSRWRRAMLEIVRPYIRGPIAPTYHCEPHEIRFLLDRLGDGPAEYAIDRELVARGNHQTPETIRFVEAFNAICHIDMIRETKSKKVTFNATVLLAQCLGRMKYRTELAEARRPAQLKGVQAARDTNEKWTREVNEKALAILPDIRATSARSRDIQMVAELWNRHGLNVNTRTANRHLPKFRKS